MREFKNFPQKVYMVIGVTQQEDGDIFYDITVNKKARVYDNQRSAKIAAGYYNRLEPDIKSRYGINENTVFEIMRLNLNPEDIEKL